MHWYSWLAWLSAQGEPLPELRLPLTVLDSPHQLEAAPAWPSMRQSLDLGYSVQRGLIRAYQLRHDRLKPASTPGLSDDLLDTGLMTGAVFGSFFAAAWMHEEWHRAVMAQQGISSRNGVFHLEAWSNGTISVDQVLDEDLAQLKEEQPAHAARLMTAGMEGQHLLSLRLGEDQFFADWGLQEGESLRRSQEPAWLILLMNDVNNLFYYATCTGPSSDELTEAENRERQEELGRDFTGLDCNAWVYDMMRPEEPYGDRGEHPYGEGVDRYRSWSDLREEEQALLRRVTWLQGLNLLNPLLFGFEGFRSMQPGSAWTARAGLSVAPFGYSVDGRAYFKGARRKSSWALRSYVSGLGWSPGVEATLVEEPLTESLSLSAGLDLWLQPLEQRWDATEREAGGRLRAQLSWRVGPHLELWTASQAKTAGWVEGEVSLEPLWGGQLGLGVWAL